MALSNVALFGGAFLTPVFAGKITHSLGWQWTFYFVAIFTAVALPFMFFFVPETAFRRADYLNTDFLGDADSSRYLHGPPRGSSDQSGSRVPIHDTGKDNASMPGQGTASPAVDEKAEHAGAHENTAPEITTRDTAPFVQTLRLFNGRRTDESFFKLLLRPFPLFLHPGILWVSCMVDRSLGDRTLIRLCQACLTQGVLIGWTVFIGVVLARIFMGPPLWFDEVQTGYLYTGAFIGSILGLILSGLLSDWINKIMIKLNKGKYEPEFRILLVFFQLIFGGIGLYGFGIVAQDIQWYGWLLADVFFMFVIMGMVMGAVASALYIVDAHRKLVCFPLCM